MPRKLRIVMVATCPFPANHGTPGAIRELSMFLHKHGHEVHVVTYPQSEPIDVEGLIIHRVGESIGARSKVKIGPSFDRLVFDALMVPKLIEVIRRHDIDVIHTHNYEGAIAGGMARLVTGRPMVYTGINSMADELPTYSSLGPAWFSGTLGKLLDRVVPAMGSLMMLLSDELKDYLTSIGHNSKKMYVIPPGIDSGLFTDANPEVVLQRFPELRGRPIVLYTGALERFQRLDLLVDAMADVRREIPNVALLVAGNVASRRNEDMLYAQLDRHGMRDCLFYEPVVPLKDLRHYLAVADVAAVPRPYTPGFPIKTLNCMAAGRAIVTFAGSAKALCHGYDAYVARNEDVADYASGIKLLLEKPELAAVFGQRAQDTANRLFGWDTLALGTAELYYQLLDNGDKVDTRRLGAYLKASYSPIYKGSEPRGIESFPLPGPVTFAEYG